jgi:hypothetical protein
MQPLQYFENFKSTKSNSSPKCDQRRQKNFVFQTEYLELYEEAASSGLTILLPDIREDILIRPLKETVPFVEGLYCKRAIQCLASSEILTPPPPHRPASVCQRWANTLTYWSARRHRQYFRPMIESTKNRNF